MSRSYRASKEGIDRIRSAFQITGKTQEYIAGSIGCSRTTVYSFLKGRRVEKRIFEELCEYLSLELEEVIGDVQISNLDERTKSDWGEVIDNSFFYGREEEIKRLRELILVGKCQFICILGMGGIGKSCLTAEVSRQLEDSFDYLFWRTLRNSPSPDSILRELLLHTSDNKEISNNISIDEQLTKILKIFRSNRCLIVLDNLETIFQPLAKAGTYKQKYETYGEFFRRVTDEVHQSCVLVTSRELPEGILFKDYSKSKTKIFDLFGLGIREAKLIFNDCGITSDNNKLSRIVERYAGNPLALRVASKTISSLFGKNLDSFIQEDSFVFGDIWDLLNQQFNRLSHLEKIIMFWLSICREQITVKGLHHFIYPKTSIRSIIESLQSLMLRGLIESGEQGYTQQPVVMEYMTERIIEQICNGLMNSDLSAYNSFPVLTTSAKDYIVEYQTNTLLVPLLNKLAGHFSGNKDIYKYLLNLISNLRIHPQENIAYAAGTILNLLLHIDPNLNRVNLSSLPIWQANLTFASLYEVDFNSCDLSGSTFRESVSSIYALSFSPKNDSQPLLSSVDSDGNLVIWDVLSGSRINTLKADDTWIWSVAWSNDGELIAISTESGLAKIFSANSLTCIASFQAHDTRAWSIKFSPTDKNILATCSSDQTLKVWNLNTMECIRTIDAHADILKQIAFSPDGQMIATASKDATVKVWDFSRGKCLHEFGDDLGSLWSIAFHPSGESIFAAGEKGSIYALNLSTNRIKVVPNAHNDIIWSIAFSADVTAFATASSDQTVKLWDIHTLTCYKTLHGHSGRVWSVDYSPDQLLLASGADDQSIRIWDLNSYQCQKSIQGYSEQVWCIRFSSDGKYIVSTHDNNIGLVWDLETLQTRNKLFDSDDSSVDILQSADFHPQGTLVVTGCNDGSSKLWDIETSTCLRRYQKHSGWIWMVLFSNNGESILTSSRDGTIRIVDTITGDIKGILSGPDSWVWSIFLIPNTNILVSSHSDGKIYFWNLDTYELERSLTAHSGWVWSVTVSHDSQYLATCGDDCLIRIWNICDDELIFELSGHKASVNFLVFKPLSHILGSASADGTIRLWDLDSRECIRTFTDHTNQVTSIDFSPDGRKLASSSYDGSIKIWDIGQNLCINTLRAPKPYEGTNLSEVTNLDPNTLRNLSNLGALSQ